jgi:hypothetical protein
MTVAMVVAVAAGELGEHVGDVLDRVGGVLGEQVRAVIAAPPPRAERAAAVAAWRAPVPPDVRHVHASWIDAVADRGFDPVGVWRARWAWAELPATAGGHADPLGWLAAIGADQLAFALGDAAVQAPSALVRDAAARITRSPRAGRLGNRRAAIARCKLASDDDLGLARIGARAVAPHLADDALGRRALVVALPRPIGLAIAEELRSHAADPLADAPAREALG